MQGFFSSRRMEVMLAPNQTLWSWRLSRVGELCSNITSILPLPSAPNHPMTTCTSRMCIHKDIASLRRGCLAFSIRTCRVSPSTSFQHSPPPAYAIFSRPTSWLSTRCIRVWRLESYCFMPYSASILLVASLQPARPHVWDLMMAMPKMPKHYAPALCTSLSLLNDAITRRRLRAASPWFVC